MPAHHNFIEGLPKFHRAAEKWARLSQGERDEIDFAVVLSLLTYGVRGFRGVGRGYVFEVETKEGYFYFGIPEDFSKIALIDFAISDEIKLDPEPPMLRL